MDIAFLITTYNRKESCQRLVDSLQGLGEAVVALDGTDYSISGAINLNPRIHLGKAGYWKLVNMLYRNRPIAKYYIMIPDDFTICKLQIAKAIEIWESIQDPKKICLNLLINRAGVPCWTLFKPVDKGSVWLSQWVDMCFICDNRFFNAIGAIPDLHRSNSTKGSSGVGAYISRHLKKTGFNMYQVKEELATQTEAHQTSQMHK